MSRRPYFNERHENLKQRTKDFGLRVIRMWKSLPTNTLSEVLGKQLLRCATSVAANYRAACLAKSDPDFFNKIKICQEEADESCLWIEYIIEAGILPEYKFRHKSGDYFSEIFRQKRCHYGHLFFFYRMSEPY